MEAVRRSGGLSGVAIAPLGRLRKEDCLQASPVRQQHIAEHLGVSISTVSLALRGAPQVAERTRRRVHDVAAELGYEYRPRRASWPEPPPTRLTRLSFSMQFEPMEPFYANILAGAESECRRHGIELQYSQMEQTTFQVIKQHEQAQAVLLVGTIDEDTVIHLQQLGKPMVLIDNNLPHLGIDRVLTENVGSLYRAVLKLAERGHTRIAFMRGPDAPSLRERWQGYRAAIDRLGLEIIELWRVNEFPERAGKQTLEDLLSGGGTPAFSALICFNDAAAIKAIHTLQDHGLDVPGDVSVVGFDGVDMGQMTRPALTTCQVQRMLLGRLGVTRLIERANDPTAPAQAQVLDTIFIERASTRPLI